MMPRLQRPLFLIGSDCLQHWDRSDGYMCWGCCVTGIPDFGSRWERARWFIAQPFRAAFYRLFARIEYVDEWGGRETARRTARALAFEEAVLAFLAQPPTNWTSDPVNADICCFSCDELVIDCSCPANRLRELVGVHPHGTRFAVPLTAEGA